MQSICFVYEIGTWVLKCADAFDSTDARNAKARLLMPMYQFHIQNKLELKHPSKMNLKDETSLNKGPRAPIRVIHPF